MIFHEFGDKCLPHIVLIHGGGNSWWNYLRQAQVLSEKYHVILPTLDGHGEEYQKDMRIAHNGIVYVVLSKHIAEDGKTPDKALGLYVIAKNDGSGNPKPQYLNWIKGKEYNAGDIVMHKGILWECTWNNNAREPSELALGWKKK